MSHFSKIQTRIHDITILKKTLGSLGFTEITNIKQLKDSKGDIYNVDLLVHPHINQVIIEPIGFLWDGVKYNIITDLEHWPNQGTFNFFLEKLNQEYSLNVILNKTLKNGFQKIEQNILKDGSIKVIVQKWN